MRPIGSALTAVVCVISIAAAQLPAPQLISPSNNAVNVATTPIVQWMWVAGASYMMVYQVQLATDSGFASNFVCDSTFRHLPHVIGITPTLADSTTYFWRVRASDTAAGSLWGAWSEVWKFTTAAPNSVRYAGSARFAAARSAIGILDSRLCVRNAEAGSIVSVFNLNGRLLYCQTIVSNAATVFIPPAVRISGKPVVVTVTSGDQIVRRIVALP